VPYSLSGDDDPDATAFVLRQGGPTVVLSTDDARYLDEAALADDIDLAVVECGYFPETPDGTRLVTDVDAAVLGDELTHDEVLERVNRVDPDRSILTEFEHFYARTHEEFRALADGYDGVQFAHDGVTIEI